MPDYRIDDLQINNLYLKQDKELFCFGTDAVLLANFALPKKNAEVLDIGTGNGIIPILLSAKCHAKKITAVEIQSPCARLAEENVQMNKLNDLIEIVHGDINNTDLFDKEFDYITCNPPYKKNGSGIKNPTSAVAIARHEITCTLDGLIKRSSDLLKDKGKIAMVHKPERLSEIIYLMKLNRIEPKRLQLIYAREGTAPCLILIEGAKNGGEELKILPPLYIYDKDGNYTANIADLYKKEK
ncbi:MAG: tRNA1(Val) (adenine(37)-N6)-methyltransferase [Clostridia bacterium]|nr:tRNA1(Val) (adenine(37)-N6)-methyltransferase [Clostridia bacterium]